MKFQIWWKVSTYTLQISPVRVTKETDMQIYVLHPATEWNKENVRREYKHSGGDGHYPTWEQAQAALLARIEGGMERAKQALAKAQAEWKQVRAAGQPTLDPTVWGQQDAPADAQGFGAVRRAMAEQEKQ